MTFVIIILAGVALWVVARNSAAISTATTQSERSKRWRTMFFACVAVLGLLFLMKGAGFVVGIGLLLPALVVGAIVLGMMILARVTGARRRG
jgi:uncharacterized iron-regulated membrane protein